MSRQPTNRPLSRRRPQPVVPLDSVGLAAPAMRVGVGAVEPGVVRGPDLVKVNSSAFSLDRVTSGYRQTTTADFSAGAGTAATPAWGAPANADRLAVRIGLATEPMMVVAHASASWRNNSPNAISGRACFTLFNGPIGILGSGGAVYSRTTDVSSTYVNNDGNFYQISLSSLITVPSSDTADWHLTMSFQNDRGTASGSQALVRQKIVLFSSGPIPGYDSTLTADGGLT